MRRHILFGALLLSPRCFGWVEPEVVRKTLEVPVEIQGYPCAKGFAWFFADGHLKQCTVSRETAFGEARAPTGSNVNARPLAGGGGVGGGAAPDRIHPCPASGRYAELLFFSHDAPVLGYTCKGGGPLGASEGATTAFYPSGKLKQCWLAEDQIVQGVP